MIAAMGPPLVRALVGTLRVRFLGARHREGRLPTVPTGIYVFWHQRILAFAGVYHHAGFQAVVSQHGDGEMLAGMLERLGIRPIRGSTTRGGSRAIREILHGLDLSAARIVFTPDGPRGPRHVFREGAIYVASRTGLPIYPATVSFASSVSLPTWDGFIIPRPFTRGVLRLGDKVEVPPDLDREGIESFRQTVEANLRALTDSTDRDFATLYRSAKAWHELKEVDPCGATR